MEVRKLFYEDPHVRNFTANVLCCREEGSGWAVYLDQTAFYPEGGGQACDTGLLGDARVTDVQEDAYGIRHLCDRALPVGEKVEGRIDWARSFDQMKQHTGEHIVSGIIFAKYGYHNSGFHVGNDGMEVDFDGPIPQADVAWIEQTANEAVWANLPIKCWYPAEELLSSIPYRTKRALPWPVRIVDICGIDLCACCGIHVKHTGEVGLIKISCGGRALVHINEVYEQNRQVSQAFSAQMPQTGEAARKVNDALAAEKLRANTLQKQVFSYIAKEYEGRGNVLHFAVALSPGLVRELADAIAGSISGWAAVFSGEGESFSYCLAARSGDLREMGKAMTAALNGRGGGKPNFQQGSVRAERPQIEAFFAALDP